MTTRTPSRCRWSTLAASLATLLVASQAPAAPRGSGNWSAGAAVALPGGLGLADDADLADAPAEGEELYLEVLVNQVATGQIARFVLRDGQFYVNAETLQSLGLTWPGADTARGLVALDSLPGAIADYDVANQRMHLTVPVGLLGRDATHFGYTPQAAPTLDPTTRAPGLLLNYGLYAQGSEDFQSLSGWHELRLFGLGPGVWRNSATSRASRSDGEVTRSGSVRLETSWQLDFPEPMVSILVGDGYTAGLDWTRVTRFGGVRVSRNFSLQPYRVTVPLASFAGEAALPSTVDLFIDGIRQSSQQVAPGQFQINSAPVLSGVGQAQVVITDINGQSRTISFSLYNERQLLQAGLSDWSFEAGKVRRDYGLRSFSYAEDPMASGTFRIGATNALTLESHAETTRGLDMGGIGAMWLLGHSGGVLSASWASSRGGSDRGDQHTLGYQWLGRPLSLSLATLRRDPGFRDVASLEGSQLPTRVDQAFVGVNAGPGRQIGTSYVRQDQPDQLRSRYASLTWSQSFQRSRANLSISLNRDLEGNEGDGAQLYLSIPFGWRHQAWGNVQHRHQGTTTSIGAMRSISGDQDDWGWRMQASTGNFAGGQAEVNRLTRYGEWSAGVQHWNGGNTIGYASANGGLLLMEGGLYPMRRAYDAFALVSTDGIAGVPVMLENRLVGHTDRDGRLLVTRLNAWQRNDLSIDPLQLPADMTVERTRMAAVPATASGMLARFPMRSMLAVQLALRGPDGQWLPTGTMVAVSADGASETAAMVGHDGLLYLENPPAGARLSARPDDRAPCTAALPATLPGRGWIDLGELQCR